MKTENKKISGTCPVCRRTFSLTNEGLLRRHGRGSKCEGFIKCQPPSLQLISSQRQQSRRIRLLKQTRMKQITFSDAPFVRLAFFIGHWYPLLRNTCRLLYAQSPNTQTTSRRGGTCYYGPGGSWKELTHANYPGKRETNGCEPRSQVKQCLHN